MQQIMWQLGTCSTMHVFWPVILLCLEVLCNWKANWWCTVTVMDRATVACFRCRRHLKLSEIVGMEEYWVQVMMDREWSVWERTGLVFWTQQLDHFDTTAHMNTVYHWLPTTSQRSYYFHWLSSEKGCFQNSELPLAQGQSYLLFPSSPSWSRHSQMEAVGSSATFEHLITTRCRNPKDNHYLNNCHENLKPFYLGRLQGTTAMKTWNLVT